MNTLKQIILQKSSAADGGMVIGGIAVAKFATILPITISVLTVTLFVARILVAYQEYKINKKILADK